MQRVDSPVAPPHGSRLNDPLEATAAAQGIAPATNVPIRSFDDVYEEQFDFVWRSVRRLGVDPASTDDVVQEVFVVVYRKLGEFEGRSSLKTWLFGIVLHFVRRHRRSFKRKDAPNIALSPTDFEAMPDNRLPSPLEAAEAADDLRILDSLLSELDDDRREVFVLVHIEQMSPPEIAEILGVNLNTLYSRLRTARRDFEQALLRQRAREARRRP